jgi:hypothetical protein
MPRQDKQKVTHQITEAIQLFAHFGTFIPGPCNYSIEAIKLIAEKNKQVRRQK